MTVKLMCCQHAAYCLSSSYSVHCLMHALTLQPFEQLVCCMQSGGHFKADHDLQHSETEPHLSVCDSKTAASAFGKVDKYKKQSWQLKDAEAAGGTVFAASCYKRQRACAENLQMAPNNKLLRYTWLGPFGS